MFPTSIDPQYRYVVVADGHVAAELTWRLGPPYRTREAAARACTAKNREMRLMNCTHRWHVEQVVGDTP